MRSILCGCAALLALTAVAMADSTTKTDPKGDLQGVPGGRGGFDFKSASVEHAGRDIYKHRVTSWFSDPEGFPSVRLEIATGGGSRPGYMVAKFEGKAGVYAYTRKGVKRVGPARFKKHSNKSFSFKFSIEPMGLPEVYRWRWVIQSPDVPGFIDKLPNKGLVKHDVATGHD